LVGDPDQLPLDATSVCPCTALPLIAGRLWLTGEVIDRVSHHLRVPWRGSPKVVLLQSTPPVKVLGAVKVPLAP
jgi:hypothetical protein